MKNKDKKTLDNYDKTQISKNQAIIQFQNYSGNVISRMSNLGFILKTLCFTYNSFFIALFSGVHNDDINLLLIFLVLIINLIINFGFSYFNYIFLRLERWFRDYQKLKINNYNDLNFKEIIEFNPNQIIIKEKATKQKFKTVFFTFSIFYFYLFVAILNTILIIIFFLI